MLYTVPDYYGEFHCIAGDCEDTCCAGWQIAADRRSLARYRRERGPFRRRLRRSVNWREGTFRQSKDKRCAFLNEENLCDMYTALGEDSLCRTCKTYPRHVEEFENVREITLSVSCPEAARILLRKTEPVKFRSFENEREEEYEDFDPFLYSALVDGREAMTEILQDRSKSVGLRAGLMLAAAHDMQVRVNHGALFSCDEVFERYRDREAEQLVCRKMKEAETDKESFGYIKKLFCNQYQMEELREDWRPQLREAERCLYKSRETYTAIKAAFSEWEETQMPEAKIWYEQLLVYFISTYLCGAVYDGQVYAKAQLAAVSVLLIREILMARWMKNEKTLDFEDVVETVYRFSRELEHSDINLNLMEKQMRKDVIPWLRK